jgi:hypothetical protein
MALQKLSNWLQTRRASALAACVAPFRSVLRVQGAKLKMGPNEWNLRGIRHAQAETTNHYPFQCLIVTCCISSGLLKKPPLPPRWAFTGDFFKRSIGPTRYEFNSMSSHLDQPTWILHAIGQAPVEWRINQNDQLVNQQSER